MLIMKGNRKREQQATKPTSKRSDACNDIYMYSIHVDVRREMHMCIECTHLSLYICVLIYIYVILYMYIAYYI